MMLELRQNIDWINHILKGNELDSVIIDGIEKPSISKDIADRWSAISAMVQGRSAYKTKSELPSPPPVGVVLAEVWMMMMMMVMMRVALQLPLLSLPLLARI